MASRKHFPERMKKRQESALERRSKEISNKDQDKANRARVDVGNLKLKLGLV